MKKIIWLFAVILLFGCSSTRTCPTNFHASSYVTYKSDPNSHLSKQNNKGKAERKHKADRWKPEFSKWNKKKH